MTNNKFKIELLEANWILKEDTEDDLCAHGHVKIQIGEEIIVDKEENTNWTISSTALLLLRTLERNHTKEDPVGDQLLPCCGHLFVFEKGMKEVYVCGCPSGINWQVKHIDGLIELNTENGTSVIIEYEYYKNEVLNYVDKVEMFYKDNKPKNIPKDKSDRKGYLKFWEEWHTNRNKWK